MTKSRLACQGFDMCFLNQDYASPSMDLVFVETEFDCTLLQVYVGRFFVWGEGVVNTENFPGFLCFSILLTPYQLVAIAI